MHLFHMFPQSGNTDERCPAFVTFPGSVFVVNAYMFAVSNLPFERFFTRSASEHSINGYDLVAMSAHVRTKFTTEM